jgi:hypothetical protein
MLGDDRLGDRHVDVLRERRDAGVEAEKAGGSHQDGGVANRGPPEGGQDAQGGGAVGHEGSIAQAALGA